MKIILDWQKIYDFLLQNPEKTLIIKTRGIPVVIPEWLHQTNWGISEGSLVQYRDNKKRNSLHLRVYSNYIAIHLDRANPEYLPVEHLIQDFGKIMRSPTVQKSIATLAVVMIITTVLFKK